MLNQNISAMKKTAFFFAGLFLIAIAFSSCKKEYTCKCVNNTTNPPVTTTHVFKEAKKADAETACNALNTSQIGGPVCTLQ